MKGFLIKCNWLQIKPLKTINNRFTRLEAENAVRTEEWTRIWNNPFRMFRDFFVVADLNITNEFSGAWAGSHWAAAAAPVLSQPVLCCVEAQG